MKLSKEQIINAAVDIFGYSESDFDGMSLEDLKVYLEEQMPEIEAYCA